MVEFAYRLCRCYNLFCQNDERGYVILKSKLYKATRFFVPISFLLSLSLVQSPVLVNASTYSDLLNQQSNLNNKISQSELSQQSQQSLADQLKSQVDNLNSSIQSAQNSINSINNNIVNVNSQISDLNLQIGEKETEINDEKSKLELAVSEMYIEQSTDTPILDLAQENVSSAITQQQNYQAVESQISQKAAEIQQMKQQLEQQRQSLVGKQNSLKAMQQQQQAQKDALNSQLALKNQLLDQTISTVAQLQQTINQYQVQLASVNSSIELLNYIGLRGSFVPASGDLVVVNNWVNSGDYYAQWQQPWGSMAMGSGWTMADSGCLVTSLTMVANYYGIKINPGNMLSSLKQNGLIGSNAFTSSSGSIVFSGKTFSWTSEGANWGDIENRLNNGMPVIAHLGPEGHYVVISGKDSSGRYIVEDPYYSPTQNSGYSSDDVDQFYLPTAN